MSDCTEQELLFRLNARLRGGFQQPYIENLPDKFQPAKTFEASKQGYLIRLTDEMRADIIPVTLGRVQPPEELEAKRKALRAVAETYKAETLARLAKAHPALQPVIAHHSPAEEEHSFLVGSLYCAGCDAGAYAEDDPEWPCSTIELILEGLDGEPAASCPTRLMDGRNELRCWLPMGHEGDCR